MTERLWEVAGEIKDLRHDGFVFSGDAHSHTSGSGHMSGTCPAGFCANGGGAPTG